MKRNLIVSQGRTWVGTTYGHLGRLKKTETDNGLVDCAGFIFGLSKELGYQVEDVATYSHNPDSMMFKRVVENHLDRIELSEVKAGDILIFAFINEPQHIALVSDINPMYIIHAFSRAGKVTEHIADKLWQSRIRGAYRYKNIEED